VPHEALSRVSVRADSSGSAAFVSPRLDRLAIGFCIAAMLAALAILPGLTGWGVAIGVIALIAVGGVFWVRSSEQRDTRGEIAKLLLFGLAAALPSLIISHAIDKRQAALDRRQAALEDALKARQRAQDLQLQIGFQGDLHGVNLAGRDLRRFQLPGRNLEDADLRSAQLQDANLERADLDGARLDGARLDRAYLVHARLRGATLAGASLRDAVLYSAHLENACLAPLRRRDRSPRPTDLRGAHLAGAYLGGASFAGADLRHAAFTEDLRDARQLDQAVFVGARAAGAAFPPGLVDLRASRFRTPARPLVPAPPEARTDAVEAVSDGDTAQLRGLGKVELLGVAAPSVSDPTGLGVAAREYARELLQPGEPVRYATVPQEDDAGVVVRDEDGEPMPLADAFGRTFAYVWRMRPDDGPAGLLVNERLVALGYAKTSLLGENVDDATMRAVRAARDEARRTAHGIWSACVP
jgi:uncharacterized protein YjbI with pentapeptide repeats